MMVSTRKHSWRTGTTNRLLRHELQDPKMAYVKAEDSVLHRRAVTTPNRVKRESLEASHYQVNTVSNWHTHQ